MPSKKTSILGTFHGFINNKTQLNKNTTYKTSSYKLTNFGNFAHYLNVSARY
jgi:hypothetical protein